MKPLRHPQDFLDLAAAHCSRAAARACREGNYTPPQRVTLSSGIEGWAFAVTSQRGSRWLFEIELLEAERRYRVVCTPLRQA